MATLNSLAADVYTITNRPDLVTETRVALRKAVFKFHLADTFSRDLAKTRVQTSLLTPTVADQWRYQLDTQDAEQFPRFRRLSYLVYPPELCPPLNIIPAPLRDVSGLWPDARAIKVYSIDDIFDSYRTERPQYATLMGSALNVKLGWGMDYFDIYYFQYPLVPSVVTDPITSWICDQYPDAVIEEACSTVFKMIGKDDEAGRYLQLFGENLAMIKGIAIGEDAQ